MKQLVNWTFPNTVALRLFSTETDSNKVKIVLYTPIYWFDLLSIYRAVTCSLQLRYTQFSLEIELKYICMNSYLFMFVQHFAFNYLDSNIYANGILLFQVPHNSRKLMHMGLIMCAVRTYVHMKRTLQFAFNVILFADSIFTI